MSSYHVDPRELVKSVMLENEEKEEELQTTLENLDRNFSVLMVAVRSALDHKLQHQQLVLVDFIRWIEHRMKWVGQLSSIVDFDEIFLKLHPCFDFLDCGLIVDMSEQFLKDIPFGENDLVGKLKEHKIEAKRLRSSTTVKQLRDDLKKIYFPHHTNPINMPQIYIALNNTWDEANIEALYLLIGHLLPHKSKQSILKYIEIHTGSVHIKYIVHESKADCLIAYAQGKLQFMRLIGIFGLIIDGEPILDEDENMNFTFESGLVEATKFGHNEAVQFLIKLGGDVDHCDEEGRTVLMLASKGGHEQVVLTLVSAGCNVNIQGKKGCTALMIASQNGHTQVIEQLLKEHADVNIQNKNGWTALMIASQNGHTHVIKQLLKEHANVNIPLNDGWTALMIASQNGHTRVIEQLLKEHANVNIPLNDGWTALMIASQNGHTHVIEQLLKARADVNIQTNDGFTALMIASQNGHTHVVEQLLKERADVNIQTNDGFTALMIASQNGLTQVVEQLLKKGADINIQNKEGTTALIIASQNGHTHVVEQLLKECADVNIQTNDGFTALTIASQNGHTHIIEQLLKEHADVNTQNNDGWTALMIASQNGLTQVVEQLLKKGTDINIQNKGGTTALIIASQNGHTHIAEQLLKEHADVNTQNNDGWTALMIASQNGHIQVVELLTNELVDIDVQKIDGSTALMLACYSGHLQVAECLLQSFADPHIIAYNGTTAFSLGAYSGNRDLVNMLLDKAEPTTDEVEKAVVQSCYGGHPTLITFLSNKLTYLTNDQRELLDSCVKGDLAIVIMKTLDSPDNPLVLGLTPLMIASSCGHVDIVDALIQAGANVNEQESHLGLTPLFFALRGNKSFSITATLLMYGAYPNVIADNSTPLDVAKEETTRELLISYGGQTMSQLLGKKKYEPFDLQSLLPTFGVEHIPKSLLTTDNITMYEESRYTLKRETKKKTLELQSFTSLTTSFT